MANTPPPPRAERTPEVAAVARELGVERSVLKGWVDNFAAGLYEKDRDCR